LYDRDDCPLVCAAAGVWSEAVSFVSPPVVGRDSEVYFSLFGDMGTAEPDATIDSGHPEEVRYDREGRVSCSSYSSNSHQMVIMTLTGGGGGVAGAFAQHDGAAGGGAGGGAGAGDAHGTVRRSHTCLAQPPGWWLTVVVVVILQGDISYARGYDAQWDEFFDQVQHVAARVPWMAGSGNHERDAPTTSPARPQLSFYPGRWGAGGGELEPKVTECVVLACCCCVCRAGLWRRVRCVVPDPPAHARARHRPRQRPGLVLLRIRGRSPHQHHPPRDTHHGLLSVALTDLTWDGVLCVRACGVVSLSTCA
jgi:hypothetical protein